MLPTVQRNVSEQHLQRKLMATYNREGEIKAFDSTKAGVKGLVDAGVSKIPRFFHLRPDSEDALAQSPPTDVAEIPIIDLGAVRCGGAKVRDAVVDLVRRAAETFGFFQVVNHGIPQAVLDKMLGGVRRFNEQDSTVKMRYYTRDDSKKVVFNTNFDLYKSAAANWRDTLLCILLPQPAARPDELPDACRDIILEYGEHIEGLGHLLFEILSEGLGLDAGHLAGMGCAKSLSHLSHYYPPCPEPQLTIGTSKHSDPGFITVLLQDNIGGLQILHQNQWINVPPINGALVVNVGDLLQLISNDKFKSVEHRVLANKNGPRISVACIFSYNSDPAEKHYGPITELLSETNPPKYKDVTVKDYVNFYHSIGLNGKTALNNYVL